MPRQLLPPYCPEQCSSVGQTSNECLKWSTGCECSSCRWDTGKVLLLSGAGTQNAACCETGRTYWECWSYISPCVCDACNGGYNLQGGACVMVGCRAGLGQAFLACMAQALSGALWCLHAKVGCLRRAEFAPPRPAQCPSSLDIGGQGPIQCNSWLNDGTCACTGCKGGLTLSASGTPNAACCARDHNSGTQGRTPWECTSWSGPCVCDGCKGGYTLQNGACVRVSCGPDGSRAGMHGA